MMGFGRRRTPSTNGGSRVAETTLIDFSSNFSSPLMSVQVRVAQSGVIVSRWPSQTTQLGIT
jgi:hypothetical protein